MANNDKAYDWIQPASMFSANMLNMQSGEAKTSKDLLWKSTRIHLQKLNTLRLASRILEYSIGRCVYPLIFNCGNRNLSTDIH